MVDRALLERLRRASYQAMLRQSVRMFVYMLVLGIALTWLSWQSWGASSLIFVLLPLTWLLTLWRSSFRVARLFPVGSYIGYAVTPDGALHSSNVMSTCVQNPGTVGRLGASRDCWIISTSAGMMPIPRELIPDADAALLIRHLPGAAGTLPASGPRP